MAIYSDLDINFTRHPGTGDVMRITDIEAIKTALKNILNGKPFDKPFDPNFGSTLHEVLFTNFSPASSVILKRIIEEKIALYEPRVKLVDVVVNDADLDSNSVSMEVVYDVNGFRRQTLTIEMDRIR